MKELNITEEQVQVMENADAPNASYNCFYGCYLIKEGLVKSLNNFYIMIINNIIEWNLCYSSPKTVS